MDKRSKRQKRASIKLNININAALQEVEEIEVSEYFSTKKFLKQLTKQTYHKNYQFQNQIGCLMRTNRLIVDTYELYRQFNVPVRQGNILLKMFDKILLQLQQIKVSYIKFDHRQLYKSVFIMNDEQNNLQSSRSLIQIAPLRIWDIKKIKKQIILAKKNVLLRQIYFLISNNLFTTSLPNKIIKNQKKVSVINTLRRISKINKVKGFHNEISKRQSLEKNYQILIQNQQKLPSSKLLNRKSGFNKNILDFLKLKNKLNEENVCYQDICYNITWNDVNKQYHNLFRSKTSKQYQFIDKLNEYVKKLLQSKEETGLTESLKENFNFAAPMIILITLGFLLLMISNDVVLIAIVMTLILLMVAYLIYKLINVQIYTQASYRRDINRILQKRFQESSESDFILELCEDSLNIKVLNQQIK